MSQSCSEYFCCLGQRKRRDVDVDLKEQNNGRKKIIDLEDQTVDTRDDVDLKEQTGVRKMDRDDQTSETRTRDEANKNDESQIKVHMKVEGGEVVVVNDFMPVQVVVEERTSQNAKKKERKGASDTVVSPHDWGFPGYLTTAEQAIFDQFSIEANKRDTDWRDTIFSFGYNEKEEYAYCRWLRARTFDLHETIKMIDQATELSREPKKYGFYKDPNLALGIEESIFKSQYPQVFTGNCAKNSCPLFISMPGMINMSGIDSITTIDNVNKYQWHSMMHSTAEEFRKRQNADSNFKRFQTISILDLKGLKISKLTGQIMDVVKHQSHVDALCFPEVMNRLILINAPSYFAATWKIIKYWIDARTASRVEIYSSKSKYEKRLKELIDDENLPEEYGGTGKNFFPLILEKGNEPGLKRRITKIMTMKSKNTTMINLSEGEVMQVVVYTKAKVGGKFSVVSKGTESGILGIATLNQVDDSEVATMTEIVSSVKGPGQFKVNGVLSTDSSSRESFLVVVNVSQC